MIMIIIVIVIMSPKPTFKMAHADMTEADMTF